MREPYEYPFYEDFLEDYYKAYEEFFRTCDEIKTLQKDGNVNGE